MAKKAVIRHVAKKLKVQTIHIPEAMSKAGRVINVARLLGCAISDTKAPENLKKKTVEFLIRALAFFNQSKQSN